MELNIRGDVALVTASSSGLGKASAKQLAEEGANVVVNGRDEEKLERVVSEISSATTGEVTGIPADLTDDAELTALVETTVDQFGSLDHLVANTGGPPPLRFADTDRQDWYDAFDLVVMSIVKLFDECIPHLEADGGGTIVTIAARATKEPISMNVLTGPCRMPIIGLSKTLSRDLAPVVRVNSVLPGAHETPRNQDLFEMQVNRGEYDSPEAVKRAFVEGIPADRFGEAKEFGELVAFLSSDRAQFLTGATIPMDGGASRSAF